MGKSQMLPAVLQALLLLTFSSLIWHNVAEGVFKEMEQHERWRNYTDAQQLLFALNSENATTTIGHTINGTTHYNITINRFIDGNGTTNGSGGENNDGEESYYWSTLPRELLFAAVILPLQYVFQMWLERTFPGRARPTSAVTSEKDSDAGEGSDAQEDEFVKRLIAQGKIRRSSLSWGNTFLKWLIDMTLGQIWRDHILYTLMEGAWYRHPLKEIWSDLKWGFIFRPWAGLFSFRPLASLLSFIVVPAHQRIVFLEGANLLWNVFLAIFFSTVLPWAIETEFVGWMVSNMTEDASKRMAAHVQSVQAAMPTLPALEAPEVRLGDEL